MKVTKVAEIENDLAEVKKNQEEHQTLSSETLFQKMNELIQDTYSSGKSLDSFILDGWKIAQKKANTMILRRG